MDENKDYKSRGDEELEIDLMEYVRRIWNARKLLLKVAAIGAVVGLIVSFSLPKQYTVEVTLSPESGKGGGSSISGMAAMLGLGPTGGGGHADALNISMFPDILASTPFALELFDIRVKTLDGKIDTTLVAYLDEQKSPWWNGLMALPRTAINSVMSLFSSGKVEEKPLDPFRLTGTQRGKVGALHGAITAAVDKKTGMTTVSVTLQDPLVAATVADTVLVKIQEYITAYRVSKAKEDCEYLEQLCEERRKEYYEAQRKYANYEDANRGLNLQKARIEGERLQNDMNLSYQVYAQVATQLQVARAKVQEAKPVFAVVEPASVPLTPSGTGWKIFVLGFVFLAVATTLVWVLFGKDLFDSLKEVLNESGKK